MHAELEYLPSSSGRLELACRSLPLSQLTYLSGDPGAPLCGQHMELCVHGCITNVPCTLLLNSSWELCRDQHPGMANRSRFEYGTPRLVIWEELTTPLAIEPHHPGRTIKQCCDQEQAELCTTGQNIGARRGRQETLDSDHLLFVARAFYIDRRTTVTFRFLGAHSSTR